MRVGMGFQMVAVLGCAIAAQAGLAQSASGTPCLASPADAARQGSTAVSSEYGYRVQSVRWDRMLGRGWAIVASCEHPDYPTVTVALESSAAQAVPVFPAQAARAIVRVGDTVNVTYYEDLFHIEMIAVAQASGGMGDRIRVRVHRGGMDAGTADQYVTAMITGPHSLKMQR